MRTRRPSTTAGEDAAVTVWYEGKLFKSCIALMPFIRWGIVAAMFLTGLYLYQRDTNAQTIVNVADVKRDQDALRKQIADMKEQRDRQLDGMDKKMLTREVYEAYHTADSQRMDRMEKMMEQLIQNR